MRTGGRLGHSQICKAHTKKGHGRTVIENFHAHSVYQKVLFRLDHGKKKNCDILLKNRIQDDPEIIGRFENYKSLHSKMRAIESHYPEKKLDQWIIRATEEAVRETGYEKKILMKAYWLWTKLYGEQMDKMGRHSFRWFCIAGTNNVETCALRVKMQ